MVLSTIEFITSRGFNGIDDIKDIQSAFFKKKITVSYDLDLKNNKCRMIFSSSKTLRGESFDDVCRECNGLILEASNDGWKPLVIPINSPKSDLVTKKVNDWLNKQCYSVYAIEDGTIINLYYYNDEWIFSTARGIHMNNVSFNKKTYKEMFETCVVKNQVNPISVDDFYNILDKNSCYTFGFKHPDSHPFFEGKSKPIYKVWYVQQANLTSLEVKRENPFEKNTVVIPSQKVYNFRSKRMDNIYKNLASAYDEFIRYKSINYGYILISRYPEITGDYTCIMLESSLLREIRNIWYNGTYIKASKIKSLNRESIIYLGSFLNHKRLQIFTQLFPNCFESIDFMIKKENEMIAKIIKHINSNKELDSDEKSNDIGIVSIFANKVKSVLTISLYENPEVKVREIIRIPENFDLYYKFIYG